MPAITRQLAQRIKQNDNDYSLSRHGGLYLCMAHIDENPAGVGILYMENGIGLLADATTLPEFRDKGCHKAMIGHCITRAEKHGCDLLTSFVELGSASHLNLERADSCVAYTKSMWWRV